MKGAYEYFVLVFLGMTFVLMGFSMVEVMLDYNQARLYQETIVSLIERHHRFDEDIANLIKERQKICNKCQYQVIKNAEHYEVSVLFKLDIKILAYKKNALIKTYTQRIL